MKTETDLNLLELLEYIHPADCDYTEWLSIGMALKEAGYTCADWDEWSKRDPERYHAGEAWRKWDSFKGAATPITAGTLVQMAKDRGWEPARSGHELDWEDEIGGKDSQVVVKKGWLESIDIKEPETWDPVEQLLTYLDVLFTDEENVGYVTEVWEKDGKILPTSGSYDRTAVQLKAALKHCEGDIGAVIGDTNPDAGAWIRFNPLDGKGVRNENVTDLRYALVESDETELGQQNAILRELELPIAALVYSGGKSLHAIVHIDAPNYEEYRKRVEFLYDICRKNGLQPDKQNKNPSRLSRMPGVMRKGHKQFLLGTNIGKKNWEEWREWIESVNDDLPDPEPLSDVWDHLPPLSDPLIDGVLRKGHKMLIAGPSKAGKSFALIEMVIAIAEGRSWMGFPCAQGRVLYVNLELDRASCLHRFRDVYNALGWPPNNIGSIDIWNLRGKSVPMDKLAPKLIRRASKKDFAAIVIDPIYKVLTGDENSADQMAAFCNQFDRVCSELGAAVIYCHHHSKGYQGQKRSMDRASGSGVFARDPDALLDMVELEMTDALRKQEENKRACKALTAWMDTVSESWRHDVGLDDRLSEAAFLLALGDILPPKKLEEARQVAMRAKESAETRTAWRIEGTLREFARFAPVNVWFDYPIHVADESGSLKDIRPESDKPPYEKGADASKKKAEQERMGKNKKVMAAYTKLSKKGPVRVGDIAGELGIDKQAARRWIDACTLLSRNGNGYVFEDLDDSDEKE